MGISIVEKLGLYIDVQIPNFQSAVHENLKWRFQFEAAKCMPGVNFLPRPAFSNVRDSWLLAVAGFCLKMSGQSPVLFAKYPCFPYEDVWIKYFTTLKMGLK